MCRGGKKACFSSYGIVAGIFDGNEREATEVIY